MPKSILDREGICKCKGLGLPFIPWLLESDPIYRGSLEYLAMKLIQTKTHTKRKKKKKKGSVFCYWLFGVAKFS